MIVREIKMRLRDTPVQTQWSQDFWQRKRGNAPAPESEGILFQRLEDAR